MQLNSSTHLYCNLYYPDINFTASNLSLVQQTQSVPVAIRCERSYVFSLQNDDSGECLHLVDWKKPLYL